jgi:hypothetical protein
MTLNTLERKNIMSIKREVELYVDEVQLAGQHPAVVILDDDDDDISEMTETDMLASDRHSTQLSSSFTFAKRKI